MQRRRHAFLRRTVSPAHRLWAETELQAVSTVTMAMRGLTCFRSGTVKCTEWRKNSFICIEPQWLELYPNLMLFHSNQFKLIKFKSFRLQSIQFYLFNSIQFNQFNKINSIIITSMQFYSIPFSVTQGRKTASMELNTLHWLEVLAAFSDSKVNLLKSLNRP